MVDLETLIAGCRDGDALAWEELVRRFQSRVFGFALHYLRDPEEAREIAQEIFVKVYQSIGHVHDARTFMPWMLRLARNCCIDRVRSLDVRRHLQAGRVAASDELESGDASPEESMLAGARRALLHRALDRLTSANREILILKDIQQMRLEEISSLLGVPLGTIKSRSNRARTELAHAVRALEGSVEGAR